MFLRPEVRRQLDHAVMIGKPETGLAEHLDIRVFRKPGAGFQYTVFRSRTERMRIERYGILPAKEDFFALAGNSGSQGVRQ